MKKLLSILIALGLVASLAACGGAEEPAPEPAPEPEAEAPADSSTEAPADEPAEEMTYDQDFTLVNDTGVEIYYFYASPATASDWEEDILGESTLPAGESLEVDIEGYDGEQYWDFMVEDMEGTQVIWEDIDLYTVSTVTLSMDADGNVIASFDVPMDAPAADTAEEITYEQDFALVNNTGVEIYYFYASPVGASDWEEDILGDMTLLDGETLEVSIDREGEQYWDFMVEDMEGTQVIWENIDLYTVSTVTLTISDGAVMANFA